MTLLSRIDRKIKKHGEEFLVNGVTPEKGFFRVLDTGKMHAYLDDTEAATVIRPALFLVTSADAAIAVDDTIARDGRNYLVRKLSIERFGGEAVVKVAVLT